MLYLFNYAVLSKSTWTSSCSQDGVTVIILTLSQGTNKKLDNIYETLLFSILGMQ